MKKPDPFGFDMSVAAAKSKRRRSARADASGGTARRCDHKGCTRPGQYRAPRSPDVLDDYLWFCRQHARAYNLKWNFFKGQSEGAINAQTARDRVWERTTHPPGRAEGKAWARLGLDDPHQMIGGKGARSGGKKQEQTRRLLPTERRAIQILEAKDSWSKAQIRTAYRKLIKVVHPDLNGGDRSQEEQLQQIIWAWNQIKDSRSFK